MADVEDFLFVADRLWLDFVNTEKMAQGQRVDLLPDSASVTTWLKAAALGDVAWPEEQMGRLRVFRASLRELAERLVGGEMPSPSAQQAINSVLASRSGHPEIVSTGSGRFVRREHWALRNPLGLLAPVAEDAARLLCDGDPALVKKCENPACILFFYDTTKNHTRRWHSMATCGNRHKAAARYRRLKERRS